MPSKPHIQPSTASQSRYTGSLTDLAHEQTMTRTPAALAWLIRQHATLQGEILKIEKEVADFNETKSVELQTLRDKLAALTQTLGLHEIKIAPEEIHPVLRRNPEERVPLNYGLLTRLILSCLREAKGVPCTSEEITAYILQRVDLVVADNDMPKFRRKVQRRLKNLAHDKKVQRLHDPKSNQTGVWLLAI